MSCLLIRHSKPFWSLHSPLQQNWLALYCVCIQDKTGDIQGICNDKYNTKPCLTPRHLPSEPDTQLIAAALASLSRQSTTTLSHLPASCALEEVPFNTFLAGIHHSHSLKQTLSQEK